MLEFTGCGRVDIKETLRYLGYYGGANFEDMQSELEACEKLITPALAPKAYAEEFKIVRCGGKLDLGFCITESKSLSINLEGCNSIVLFAATVGAEVDRLILKYGRLSPSRSLILQAMGSSAIECWCDDVNAQIKEKFGKTKPRFSCGYGDLQLELQRDIFTALDVTRRLGITLSDNLFMTPTKSVTAIIGIL